MYDAEKAEKGSMTHDVSTCATLRARLKGAASHSSASGEVAAGAKRGSEEGAGELELGLSPSALAKRARATISGLFGPRGVLQQQ